MRLFLLLGLLLLTLLAGLWWAWVKFAEPARLYAENFPLEESLIFQQSIVVQDEIGQDLGRVFVENRINLTLPEVSPIFLDMLLFSEDRRFYEHPGICWRGFLRALWVNIQNMSFREGGSTISQQLAKNLIRDRGKTVVRKLREAFLALRLEREFDKREILEMYLNRVYFGNGYHGLEAASRGYFGHRASTLNWMESSVLVTLLQSPTALSPYKNSPLLRKRSTQLLNQFNEYSQKGGMGSQEFPKFLPRVQKVNGMKSFPVARVVSSAQDLDPGAVVKTTIRGDWQVLLEDYAAVQTRPIAAGVVQLATGHLKAYVGGRAYLEEPYDRFFSMRRNTGTMRSPFTLPTLVGFLEAYPKSTVRLLYPDALALNWRPALATNEPMSPAELLSALPALAGFDSDGLRLVQGQPPEEEVNLLPGPDKARLKMLNLAQQQSKLANKPLTMFVSSSLGNLDGWALWVGGEYGLVVWVGEDRPKLLGSAEDVQSAMAAHAENLVALLDLSTAEPTETLTYVERSFGTSAGATLGGSSPVLGTPLQHVLPPFVPSPDLPGARLISELPIPPHQPPLTRRLPAPRPNLLTYDGEELAVSTMRDVDYFVWPRPEGFVDDARLQAFARSQGVDPLRYPTRYLPVPVDSPIVGGSYTSWPAFGRTYNHIDIYRSIVGLAGIDEADDGRPVDGLPLYPSWRGRFGLERWLDRRNLTEDGLLVFFPDLFGYLQDVSVTRPTAIPPIVLTLNHRWQSAAHNIWQSVHRGAFVLLDAESGAVRVAISTPSDDEFNRCFMGQYPPASAIKPFVALASLKTSRVCPELEMGPVELEGITFANPGESGWINMREAMQNSRNSYFMKLALLVGADELIDLYMEAGLGQRPRLQVPAEKGNVPGMYAGSSVGKAELVNMSIGQGNMLASPLQMARAYGWLGSKGRLPSSSLVEPGGGALPTLDLDPELWAAVDDALGAVVGAGTGTSAWLGTYPSLRGKTGTAQVGKKGRYWNVAWFCGYVYLDGTLHAFAAAVEGVPGQSLTGGKNAAPLVRRFLQSIAVNGDFPPPEADPVVEEPAAEARDSQPESVVEVPASGSASGGALADQVLMRQWD
jgi:membrane peptidoglycan carboxypeptidase